MKLSGRNNAESYLADEILDRIKILWLEEMLRRGIPQGRKKQPVAGTTRECGGIKTTENYQ